MDCHLGGGLSRFDPVRGVFITYSHDENGANSLSSNLVRSVLVDNNDDLWVGTESGLDKFDTEKKEFIHYRHVIFDTYPVLISGGSGWYPQNMENLPICYNFKDEQ